jgi:Fe-Mn family superoxide dismutase
MRAMNRRDAIKVIGGGAALVGLGALSSGRAAEPGATPAAAVRPPFTLPKLAYDFGALEPHFDAQTMEIHYSKHHAAYIKNANKALEAHPELATKTGAEILLSLGSVEEPARTTLRNNVGGHLNHTFWWSILSPKGGGAPKGALAAAITKEFGSYDGFKFRFSETALRRFGSGWAWLSNKGGKLEVHSTPNQESPIADGAVPIIGIDVWEHAYYLKFQNKRADFITAFWSVVDWDQANWNYSPVRDIPSDS